MWGFNEFVQVGEIFVTGAGIVIGAKLVVYQLQRQHESSLGLQREQARHALHLDIFKEIMAACGALTTALTTAHMTIGFAASPFKLQREQQKAGLPPNRLTARASDFVEGNGAVLYAFVGLLKALESWEIAAPELNIFRKALASSNHDLSEAFSELFPAVLLHLPIDVPGIPDPIVPPPPTDPQLQTIDRLASRYADTNVTMGAYVHDLIGEAQNTLLGDIFVHRVARRVPLDPTVKVIATDAESVRALTRYFDEDTALGRCKQATNDRIAPKVADKQTPS